MINIMTITAAPSAEYKLRVDVGDRQTDRQTDIVVTESLLPTMRERNLIT